MGIIKKIPILGIIFIIYIIYSIISEYNKINKISLQDGLDLSYQIIPKDYTALFDTSISLKIENPVNYKYKVRNDIIMYRVDSNYSVYIYKLDTNYKYNLKDCVQFSNDKLKLNSDIVYHSIPKRESYTYFFKSGKPQNFDYLKFNVEGKYKVLISNDSIINMYADFNKISLFFNQEPLPEFFIESNQEFTFPSNTILLKKNNSLYFIFISWINVTGIKRKLKYDPFVGNKFLGFKM